MLSVRTGPGICAFLCVPDLGAVHRWGETTMTDAAQQRLGRTKVRRQMTIDEVGVRTAHKVILPLSLLLLVGCSPKHAAVLSGSNAEEMQMSIIRLSQALSSDRREEFERAVETIMLSTTDRRLSADGHRLSPQAMSLLRGRTVSQVIENAKLIRSASASL